jgi:hypothetical protein
MILPEDEENQGLQTENEESGMVGTQEHLSDLLTLLTSHFLYWA